MAKAREIKRRIRSIRNTMQLTRAMKMVSAAKLRRAQDRIVRVRPFARRLDAVLRSLAARVDREEHPLLATREERRVELLVIASDKGLAGSFNTNVLKAAATFAASLAGREITIQAIGRKSSDFFRRRGRPIASEKLDLFRSFDFSTAAAIARDLMDRYAAGEVDAVYLAYNEFKSAMGQQPVIERVLPVVAEESAPTETTEDYIYEPSAEALLARILPQSVEIQIFRALLESNAAEHAARMTAMDSATKNAGELIDSLTLYMNRVRQAAITTDIIEVVSGAAALG